MQCMRSKYFMAVLKEDLRASRQLVCKSHRSSVAIIFLLVADLYPSGKNTLIGP